MSREKETALAWDLARIKWLTAIEIYQDLYLVASQETLDHLQTKINCLNAKREATYAAYAAEMDGNNV